MSVGEVVSETTVDYEPSAVSILNDEEIAVGESSDGHSVRIYGIAGGTPDERKKLALSGAITDLAYRYILIIDIKSFENFFLKKTHTFSALTDPIW